MNGHAWEIFIGLTLALGAAFFGAIASTLFRRAEKTGERLGRLEKWADFERGRRAGMREKARKESER